MKIVIIGAGSRSFGRACVADVLNNPDMQSHAPELALVDIDAAKLEDMRALAERIQAHCGATATITATTDREQALPGADYVLISVTRCRYELWEQDFRVPLSHGFLHAYGENGGPGALFHALRSIHLILPICRDIERLCPDALVMNYSNPESRVLLAILTLTTLRAVGLCHGQGNTRRLISEYLDKPEDEIETVGAGINHFFWMQRIADRETGKDLYPRVREAVARDDNPEHTLMRKMVEVYGLITYPHNNHIGEYLQFASEHVGNKWRYGREMHPAGEPLLHEQREARLHGLFSEGAPSDEAVKPSGELGVPMILAHATNARTRFIAGNVLNTSRAVPNLLPDAVVEVPVEVDAAGFHPVPVDPLPEGLAAFCRTQMSIQKLAVAAYRERSKNLLLQALLADPVVNSIRHAEALIDEMLALQAEFLPEFS